MRGNTRALNLMLLIHQCRYLNVLTWCCFLSSKKNPIPEFVHFLWPKKNRFFPPLTNTTKIQMKLKFIKKNKMVVKINSGKRLYIMFTWSFIRIIKANNNNITLQKNKTPLLGPRALSLSQKEGDGFYFSWRKKK